MHVKDKLGDIREDECYDFRYCQILKKFTLGPNIQYCGFINDCESAEHDNAENDDHMKNDGHH